MALNISGSDKVVNGISTTLTVEDDHPLILLARMLDWPRLIALVIEDLKATSKGGNWQLGRPLFVRTHLAAFFLKVIYDKTDRDLAEDLKYNIAFGAFAGMDIVDKWDPPHFSSIEKFRNRLSPETQVALTNELALGAVKNGYADPSKLDIDSTVQEANMTYPADVELMSQMMEKLEKIERWVKAHDRSYPSSETFDLKKINSLSKGYFLLPKNTNAEARSEKFKELHTEVSRHFNSKVSLLKNFKPSLIEKMPWNIKRVFDQLVGKGEKYLKDVEHFIKTKTIQAGKILSWHLEEVACIVKGKAGKPFQFGRAIQLGRIGGNFICTANHDTVTMSDKSAIPNFISQFKRVFGNDSVSSITADKGYYSTLNQQACIDTLGEDGQFHLGYTYEHLTEEENQTLSNRRAGIEPIIGHGKGKGQLGRSRMKSDLATKAAAFGSMIGFNLRQLINRLKNDESLLMT